MAENGEKDEGEKEFEASEQRLRQAREDGDIVQSKETGALAVVLGLLIAAYVFWALTGQQMGELLFSFFDHAESYSTDVFSNDGRRTVETIIQILLRLLVPIGVLVLLLVLMLLGTRAVTFSAKKIKPDLKKLSPADNLKKKYGWSGLLDFLRDSSKMIVAGIIACFILWDFSQKFYAASAMDGAFIAGLAFSQTVKVIIAFAIFQFVLAVVDYPLQIRLRANRLKMTREELKKETKQSEGDPLLKGQRRDKATRISRGQMLQNVETSTVVMVNPTHYAVALQWDPASQKAPVVVAKGKDHLAAKIREIAINYKVPIYRDPPSTRSIFANVEIDQEILPEHFAAVAAAVQYVQTLQDSKR